MATATPGTPRPDVERTMAALETGCVTPAAIPYIEKTLAYRAAQAEKRAAKTKAGGRA